MGHARKGGLLFFVFHSKARYRKKKSLYPFAFWAHWFKNSLFSILAHVQMWALFVIAENWKPKDPIDLLHNMRQWINCYKVKAFSVLIQNIQDTISKTSKSTWTKCKVQNSWFYATVSLCVCLDQLWNNLRTWWQWWLWMWTRCLGYCGNFTV